MVLNWSTVPKWVQQVLILIIFCSTEFTTSWVQGLPSSIRMEGPWPATRHNASPTAAHGPARDGPVLATYCAHRLTLGSEEPRWRRNPLQKKLVDFEGLLCTDNRFFKQHIVQSAKFLCPVSPKWTPSFAPTFQSSSNRSEMFELDAQVVVQHESITLKLVRPEWTKYFIRSLLSCMKFGQGMRHISTALYFYGASKKSLHKPRTTSGNGLFHISYGFNYDLQLLYLQFLHKTRLNV